MRALIVSDTHRKDENLKQVIREKGPFDMFIHLGDAEGSEMVIPQWLNPECRMEMVLGNNDFFSHLDREREIIVGRYHILLTHGHYYNVSMGTERLKQEARARGFDIAMFGHTHRPCYEVEHRSGDRDLIVLNPGSLSYPRQEGHRPSYMIMETDEEGEAHFELFYL